MATLVGVSTTLVVVGDDWQQASRFARQGPRPAALPLDERKADHESEPVGFGSSTRPAAEAGDAVAWLLPWLSAGQGDVGGLVPDLFERCLFVDDPPGDTADSVVEDWWAVEQAHTATIAEVAARHTTRPEQGFFAIWTGHGYSNRGLDHIPVFSDVHGDRDYYLLEGPITAVAALLEPGRRGHGSGWRQPDLWWPADHAWIVATDVDIWCNYVGGTSALTEAIAAAVTTESHLVGLTDPLERVD